MEGPERWFLFLPQPNSNRPRKPSTVLAPEQLAVLRERLIARREEEVEIQPPGFEPPMHAPARP